MKYLSKFLLSVAALAGISILVAQEAANPKADPKPAAATVRPATPVTQQYDYKVEILTPPEVNSTGSVGTMPQLPATASGYEICNVSIVKLNIRQALNDPNPPKTREALIYSLRKPRP